MKLSVPDLVPWRTTLVVECRRCGTTVDRGTTTCPVCESSEIARHEIG
jgi:RNA polymerase subunit RPABC4/transcription elongation factor Spt4